MKAPSTSLDFERWAREQAPARRLTRGQAQILVLLGSYADRRGECFPSVSALAERAVLSERHTERLLGQLGELGLVQSSRRGRGCSARRRLCPDAPLPAPPCPRGTQPLFDAMLKPTFDAPAEATPDPPSAISDPPSGWRTEGATGREEETRAARAPHPDINDPNGVLAPRLAEVIEILEPAIGLIVEPMAFHSALAAFPEDRGHDHVQAAHIVASYGFDGGARSPVSLLRQVLRNQLQPSRSRPGGWHGGRRRPAAPVSPAMVEQTERQTATMWRLAAAAGFGGPR